MHDGRSALALCLALLAACSDADFKSQSNKDAKSIPVGVATACPASQGDELVLNVPGGNVKTQVFIDGEICPVAPAELTVIFVVDFSLSMYNAEKSRGNDQVVNSTCGRLDAAKAIVAQYQKSLKNSDTRVKIGIVQFASELVGSVPLTALDQFPAQATVLNFCRGVDGTNYKAGLEKTEAMLKDVAGTKVVYFVTDGLPTEGGGGERGIFPRHRDAALAAAKSLRTNVSGVIMNAVFLGDVAELEDLDIDPLEFLGEFAEKPERLKTVTKAEDLAKEILDLKPPKVELDLGSKSAVMQAADGPEEKITIITFEPKAGADQVWTFKTEPFKAFGGTELRGKMTLTVKDTKGETYQVSYAVVPAPAGTGKGSGTASD